MHLPSGPAICASTELYLTSKLIFAMVIQYGMSCGVMLRLCAGSTRASSAAVPSSVVSDGALFGLADDLTDSVKVVLTSSSSSSVAS